MPTECEYATECPMIPIQKKWGFRCTDDCEMQTALRYIDQWEKKHLPPKKTTINNYLATAALNAACAPEKKARNEDEL